MVNLCCAREHSFQFPLLDISFTSHSTQPLEPVEIQTASPSYAPSTLGAASSEVYKPHRRMVPTQKFVGNKFGFHCSTNIKLIFRLWQASRSQQRKIILEIYRFF
jgi:hypothetical protein